MGTSTSKEAPLAPAFQRMQAWDLKTARRVLQNYKDKDLDFGLDAQGLCELLGCDNEWAESILDAFGSSTGVINALAFICGACLVSAGPALEKAELVFDALDFDSTEKISMDEMTIAFLCCARGFCVIAGAGAVPSDEDLEMTTLQAYRDLNKGSTQSISKSEFTKWVLGFASGASGSNSREVGLNGALQQFGVIAVSASDLAMNEGAKSNVVAASRAEPEESTQVQDEGDTTEGGNSHFEDSTPHEGVIMASSNTDLPGSQRSEGAKRANLEPSETVTQFVEAMEPATLKHREDHQDSLPSDGVLPIDRQCEDHFEPLLYVPEDPAAAPLADYGSHEFPVVPLQTEDTPVDSPQEVSTMKAEAEESAELNHEVAPPTGDSYLEQEPAIESNAAAAQQNGPEEQLDHTAEQVPATEEGQHVDSVDTTTEHPTGSEDYEEVYDDDTYEAPGDMMAEVDVDDAPAPNADPSVEDGENLDYEQDFAQETPRSEKAAEIVEPPTSELVGEEHEAEAADSVPLPSEVPSEDKEGATSLAESVQEAPIETLDDDEAGARAIMARRIRARKNTPQTPAAAKNPKKANEESTGALSEGTTVDEVAQVIPTTEDGEAQSLPVAILDESGGNDAVAKRTEVAKEKIQGIEDSNLEDSHGLEDHAPSPTLSTTKSDSDIVQTDPTTQETVQSAEIKDVESTTSDIGITPEEATAVEAGSDEASNDAEEAGARAIMARRIRARKATPKTPSAAVEQPVTTTDGQKDATPGGATTSSSVVDTNVTQGNTQEAAVNSVESPVANGAVSSSLSDVTHEAESPAPLEVGSSAPDGSEPASTNPAAVPPPTDADAYETEDFENPETDESTAVTATDTHARGDSVDDPKREGDLPVEDATVQEQIKTPPATEC